MFPKPDVKPRMNRESYDAIAAEWEKARVRLSEAEQRILSLWGAELSPGAEILDLGCGTGRPLAEHLVADGLHVTGVDQSQQMLAVASRLLPDQTWLLGAIEDFVSPHPFAAVVAWDSLFHIPRAAHEAIFRKIRAALPSGGRFALTVGGSEHPAFTDQMFGHPFFYDSHSPEETEALLKGARFELIHGEFLNRPTSGRDKGRYAIVASAV